MLEDARLRSLYIMHFSMLVVSLGASIIFTGVYPYLTILDPNVTMIQYGLVVASDALGQVVFSIVVGAIIDRLGNVRLMAMLCAVLFCAGNVFYALVSLVPRCFEDDPGTCNNPGVLAERGNPRVWATFIARFIVGLGTALNAISRTYVVKVTTLHERTTHISILLLAQTIGFTLGPAVQAAVTPIGYDAIGSESHVIFDMYTVTGWISVANGAFAFILYLPGIFVEFTEPPKHDPNQPKKVPAIAAGVPSATPGTSRTNMVLSASATVLDEDYYGKKPTDIHTMDNRDILKEFSKMSVFDGDLKTEAPPVVAPTEQKAPLPDMIPVAISIYGIFSFFMSFVLLETLASPIALHQWGWSQEDTIRILGIILSAGAVLAAFCFASIGPLSKRFDERVLIIFVGIIPMIVGRLLQMPMGSEKPPFLDPNANTTTAAPDFDYGGEDRSGGAGMLSGCPFCWCLDLPRMTVTQFMIGYVLSTVGYPFSVALITSLYSKVLGRIRPGKWMAALAMASSAARVVGPLFYSWIYREEGLYATNGGLAGFLGISLILVSVFHRRFVPAKALLDEVAAGGNNDANANSANDNGPAADNNNRLAVE